MCDDNYKKKRLKDVELNLFDPDYILKKQIIEFMPKNKFQNVLDYGAGNSPWKNFISFNSYHKIDIQQNTENDIDTIIEANKSIPLKNDSFDLLLLMDVLAHTQNFDFTLKECNRLLCKKGQIIISTPFIYRENETPFDYYRLTYFGIKDILIKNNFKIRKIKKVGNFYYTIFSLINERNIKNGEIVKPTFSGKIINRILKLLAFVLNKTIFLPSPNKGDGIYHHLLISATKQDEG